MGCQTASNGRLGLSLQEVSNWQFKSPIDGTTLLFASEWLLYSALGTPPTPIDAIHHTTGITSKTRSTQIACRINYEIKSNCTASLSVFNVLNQYFLKY